MEKFTEREKEILGLLLNGLNNKEIAQKIYLSNHTVKAHVASIYKKLEVTNRVLAAIKCVQLGYDQYYELDFCKDI